MFKLKYFLILVLMAAATACKEDPALPDNLANFETDQIGLSTSGNETPIKVVLSRAVSADTPLTILLTPTNATYGNQFTTDPATTGGTISLTVPNGKSEVSFKVIKPADGFFNGDEKIDFTIQSVTQPVLLGTKIKTTLSFTAITSEGSTLTVSGKIDGTDPVNVYANVAYVDLSGNKVTANSRKAWNLAFYNGSDFRVAINPSYQSSAAPTTKTDISAVTSSDADVNEASPENLNFSAGSGSLSVIDSWDGNISSTAFAAISATDSENKVYLLSFEGSKTKDKWYKVKVNRTATGYKVFYALVGETTIKSLDVPKGGDFNFTFVSLETNAIVSAEPSKQNWDISWSYSTYNAGNNTPYWFQDFIIVNNLAGAQAAEIVSADATASAAAYTAYAEASIATTTFLTSRDAIGSKWRVTQPATGIRRDRFYVIKDPRGNVYKLKFVSMGVGSDGGERGKPVIEYKLVKKG